MSIRSKRSPSLCRHRKSGHAYAKFDGRQVWFGPYDDPRAHERFARTLAEWQALGGRLPQAGPEEGLLLADVVARYLEFAEGYYCGPEGVPTREVANLRDALRPLLRLYGTLSIEDLGLRQLKTVREQMIDSGLARKTINDRMNRILRALGWAAEEELCRPDVFGGLQALKPLRRGRTRAKEGRKVQPVAWEVVQAVLPHVQGPVAGMIELMWFTGMRPGEVCQLRPDDLDVSGAVWFYRPQKHKTEHFGRSRVVAIGPRGQEVLQRFLSRVPRPAHDAPLFSPKASMAEFNAHRRQTRGTPLWPSHERAQAKRRKATPRKRPGPAYTPNSFRGAIGRACVAAGVPAWSPNQLRHAAATRIRRELGLEAARAVLGHSSAQVTEIYAELDQSKAADAMKRLG
jgi:integrase